MDASLPRIEQLRNYRVTGEPDNFSFKKVFKKFKLKKFLLKFNPLLATARNCLLLCIKVNLFGLASRIYRAVKDSKSAAYAKFKKFWEDKIGGQWEQMLKDVKRGMKVEYKNHKNKHQDKKAVFKYMGEYDGYQWVLPGNIPDNVVWFAAAPATGAAALIPSVCKALKAVGVDKMAVKALAKKAGQAVVKKAGEAAVKAIAKKKEDKQIDEMQRGIEKVAEKEAVAIAKDNIKAGIPFKKTASGAFEMEMIHPADTKHPKYKKAFPKGAAGKDYSDNSFFPKGNSKYIIMAVVGLVVLMLVMRGGNNG